MLDSDSDIFNFEMLNIATNIIFKLAVYKRCKEKTETDTSEKTGTYTFELCGKSVQELFWVLPVWDETLQLIPSLLSAVCVFQASRHVVCVDLDLSKFQTNRSQVLKIFSAKGRHANELSYELQVIVMTAICG